MPATVRSLGIEPRDPLAGLAGGARYLRLQLDLFDGIIERALAAYNAGPAPCSARRRHSRHSRDARLCRSDRSSHVHIYPVHVRSRPMMPLPFPLIRVAAPAASLMNPVIAVAQGRDPQGSGPIVAAPGWLQGTLLGKVATAVVVIAMAMVGFMMLTPA